LCTSYNLELFNSDVKGLIKSNTHHCGAFPLFHFFQFSNFQRYLHFASDVAVAKQYLVSRLYQVRYWTLTLEMGGVSGDIKVRINTRIK